MTTETYTTWDGVPAGILADATGDLLVRRDAGSHTWVRVLDDWHPMRPDDWHASLEGVVWPMRLIAPLPSPLTDEAVRAAADAAPAPLPPVPGDRVDHWSGVPEGGVALDRVGDVAHRREGRRYWPRVGREWDPERRPDARGVGDFGPYTYIGQAADHDAARRLVEAHEAAPARPAVKVGDAVPPTRHATEAALRDALAAQGYAPASKPGGRPAFKVGDRVGAEDMRHLPVGSVVDTRDGTAAPLRVRGQRGQRGWGYGNACGGERRADSPLWDSNHEAGDMEVGGDAVLVAVMEPNKRGRAFDEELARQGYQPAVDLIAATAQPKVGDLLKSEDRTRLPVGAVVDSGDGSPTPVPAKDDSAMSRSARLRALLAEHGTHVDESGRPTAQAPAETALKVGDTIARMADLPIGGVMRDRVGDVAARFGTGRCGWVYLSKRWTAPEQQHYFVPDDADADGGTIVALVPAPVTHERIRAAVGDCAPAASPTTAWSVVGGAAEVCRRLRAERLAGLERTLAAAEARWRPISDGAGSLPAGEPADEVARRLLGP